MIVPGNTIKLVDVGTSNAAVPEVQSQSPVVKAVRTIKKKNAGAYIRLQPATSQTDKTNTQKESGNATSGRGVVYISHIPDGFYEDEMRQYFAQFGRVTRVKLARSRKTGRSRGYAFIEFQYAEVAKVVAETMNNYLLQNRLLKASYVDKQYPAAFWNQQACGPQNCPLARNRRIEIKRKNAVLSAAKELAQQGKRRRQLAKTLNRLRDAGVDYTLQVKDQVELSTGAEKNGKKFAGPNNAKQEKQTSQESVKLEEEPTKDQPEKRGKKAGGAKNTKHEKQVSEESVKVEEEPTKVQPVLLVDESDDEIEFSVPSFVIRKTLKRQSSSPSDNVSPKVKRGKRGRLESLTPKVMSPSRENLSSPQNQNGEEISISNHETRKSGRVSVIPKHISSSFHVTLSPKKSPGKENRESQSPVKSGDLPEQSNTPKVVSTASPKLQKSVEASTNKKSKNTKLSTETKIGQSLENSKMSPEVRRRNTETSDCVSPSPAGDTVIKKVSPKVNKNTALTPKQIKNNTHSASKRKTPKSEIQDNVGKKTPVASQPETAVLPKSSRKTPATKATPNQLSPIQKPSSGDRKAKMQKTPLKTPMGRKSLASSKQSNLMQKSNSEEKLAGLKTPVKTPVGRKSQNWISASSPKRSPLSHSTALKRNSVTPKPSKPTRKSLKLNK